MIQHFQTYAKMYATGGALLAIGPFAGDLTAILVWLVSFAHITVPDLVQTSMTHIITAVTGGGVAGAVTNKP